jgi:hypothetical protein
MPNTKYYKLIIAIQDHRNDRAVALLNNGTSVNCRNDLKQTPLMHAACDNNVPILLELIRRGAQIDAQDKQGYTALLVACEKGRLEIVTELLKAGADFTLKNKDGQSAIDLAEIMEIDGDTDSDSDTDEESDEETSEIIYARRRKIVMILRCVMFQFLENVICRDLLYLTCDFAS